MSEDVNRLHIELDYGEIVSFDNKYFTLSTTEENFQKYSSLLVGSYISLPVFLLKYHNIDIDSQEEFLKFPLIKNPKKMSEFFESHKLKKFINTHEYFKLDNSEKKILTIFKKLNILPYQLLKKIFKSIAVF